MQGQRRLAALKQRRAGAKRPSIEVV